MQITAARRRRVWTRTESCRNEIREVRGRPSCAGSKCSMIFNRMRGRRPRRERHGNSGRRRWRRRRSRREHVRCLQHHAEPGECLVAHQRLGGGHASDRIERSAWRGVDRRGGSSARSDDGVRVAGAGRYRRPAQVLRGGRRQARARQRDRPRHRNGSRNSERDLGSRRDGTARIARLELWDSGQRGGGAGAQCSRRRPRPLAGWTHRRPRLQHYAAAGLSPRRAEGRWRSRPCVRHCRSRGNFNRRYGFTVQSRKAAGRLRTSRSGHRTSME
mgnify:CR=1 FL=1